MKIDRARCRRCGACAAECVRVHGGVDFVRGGRRGPLVPCLQCEDSLCVSACPTGALAAVAGVVVRSIGLCVGCGSCAIACPRGVVEIAGSAAERCDGCAGVNGGTIDPACVSACPTGALRFPRSGRRRR